MKQEATEYRASSFVIASTMRLRPQDLVFSSGPQSWNSHHIYTASLGIKLLTHQPWGFDLIQS